MDRELCHCLKVTETEVRQAVEMFDLASVRQVARCTGAGSGCMACHRHIKRVIAERAVQSALCQVAEAAGFPAPHSEPAFC